MGVIVQFKTASDTYWPEMYLETKGYGKVRRVGNTDYFFCPEQGEPLEDVRVVL